MRADATKTPNQDFDYHIHQFLQMAIEQGASDLIIKSGAPPALRIDTEVHKIDMKDLEPGDTLKLAYDYLDDSTIEQIVEDKEEYDGSYTVPDLGRFRVNAFLQREAVGMVFRPVEEKVMDFDQLNLPDSVEKMPNFERGLVLVTGTTSSGKSTTVASVVDYINRHMHKHIITLEDPIEALHEDKNSIVTQREIGVDTSNYKRALKHVLRQNPDVIVFGEMRDQETVRAAFEAAETGHLVLSTLHTKSASNTVDRVLKFFPKDQQDQIRALFAEYIRAICSQRLCIRKDTDGRIPAVELMFNGPTVRKLIREDRINKLRSAIHQGRKDGMQTFDQSLVDLVEKGYVSVEEAKQHSSNPDNFELYLDDHWPDVDTGVLGDRDLE
ncbi:MAG: type IV pilus twitching motility protein PilT [bacterium]